MNIIAILDRSAGNEQVGEMWKETASFPIETPIKDILKWAYKGNDIKYFKSNLIITIDQSSVDLNKPTEVIF